MQPEQLLFVHHPSYSSGLVCLFVSFLVFFCLFVLFVRNPSSCVAQHIDHKEESPLTDDREYARGVASEGLSSAVVQKEDMFCATQHGEEKQQINPSSANRFAFVKHERRPFNNTAQVCTFGAKLCGFVCKGRAQHSIEHPNKADFASFHVLEALLL